MLVLVPYDAFSDTFRLVPINATPAYGDAWTCNPGFQKVNGRCQKVFLPRNAELISYASGWRCLPGYKRIGNRCEYYRVPTNATVNLWNSGWDCDYGYVNKDGYCQKVRVPRNGKLNSKGTDWVCQAGFYRSIGRCLPDNKPRNTQWSYIDQQWECQRGFFRSGNHCIQAPVPVNAMADQNEPLGYKCLRGYLWVAGQCVEFELPRNARFSFDGKSWECNHGFEKKLGRCVPIVVHTSKISNTLMTQSVACGKRDMKTVYGLCAGFYVIGVLQVCSDNPFVRGDVVYDSGVKSTVKGRWSKQGHLLAKDALGNRCDLQVD